MRMFASKLLGRVDFRGRTRLIGFLSRPGRRIVLRSRYGPMMEARFDDFTNKACIFGWYDDKIYKTLMTLQSNDCFLDVGANAGVWSLVAGLRVGAGGMVFSFEPQAALAAELRRNAKLNALENIVVFDLALFDKTERRCLANTSSGHTGVARLGGESASGVWTVDPMTDLRFLETAIGKRRTIIKIDTEGAELRVILGLRSLIANCDVSHIIVEVSAPHLKIFDARPHDIFALMERMGYAPLIRESPDEWNDENLHYDEIFSVGGYTEGEREK